MNREAQFTKGFRDLYDKMSWLNGLKMKYSFKDYKSSEVHCIEFLAQNEDSNVTKLAETFYMTRGAVSKLMKKLIQKGAVESYQKPENKKEVYFRLTEEGTEISQIHEKLHKQFRERDQVVFEQITDDEFNSMLRFIEKYNTHLDEEIKKERMTVKSE